RTHEQRARAAGVQPGPRAAARRAHLRDHLTHPRARFAGKDSDVASGAKAGGTTSCFDQSNEALLPRAAVKLIAPLAIETSGLARETPQHSVGKSNHERRRLYRFGSPYAD